MFTERAFLCCMGFDNFPPPAAGKFLGVGRPSGAEEDKAGEGGSYPKPFAAIGILFGSLQLKVVVGFFPL